MHPVRQYQLRMTPIECRDRGGFTLVELLLTLAVMVVVTAVVIPTLGRYQQNTALREAEDLMKSRLMRARLAAMDRAEPTSFVAQSDHSTFRIQCGNSLPAGVESLPDGVRFVADDTPSGKWSSPIWFYPNGTATDSIVKLINDRHQIRTLSVRRLTGAVTSSSQLDVEEQPR